MISIDYKKIFGKYTEIFECPANVCPITKIHTSFRRYARYEKYLAYPPLSLAIPCP
jgi:hypothetical protein